MAVRSVRLASIGVVLAILAATTPPAHADSRAERKAREHYNKGKAYYDVARFKEAAEEFEKAQAAYPDATFIYNTARCYHNLGDTKRAIFLYKSFIREAKDPKLGVLRERMIDKVRQLEALEQAKQSGKAVSAEQEAALGPDAPMPLGDGKSTGSTTAPPPVAPPVSPPVTPPVLVAPPPVPAGPGAPTSSAPPVASDPAAPPKPPTDPASTPPTGTPIATPLTDPPSAATGVPPAGSSWPSPPSASPPAPLGAAVPPPVAPVGAPAAVTPPLPGVATPPPSGTAARAPAYAPPGSAAGPQQTTLAARPARPADPAPSGGGRTWVWVLIGGVVLGAAAGFYFLAVREDGPPGTTLGNHDVDFGRH